MNGAFGLRVGPLAVLTLVVLLAHLALAGWLATRMDRLGSGAADAVRRFEVAFVQDLQAAEPPLVVGPPVRAAGPARVVVPAEPPASSPRRAASAAAEPASQPAAADPPALAASVPHATADAAAPPPGAITADGPAPAAAVTPPSEAAAPVASAASAASAAPAPFEWPPSTRLSYRLVGDFRGPVEGHARVEWIRVGDRYQVHLDVSAGGIVQRRMSSEGRLTEQGLAPQRYEEVTTVLLREQRRQVQFEADRVVLANGQTQPTLPQVQDTASQFVQLTWLFTMQRERLKAGETVVVPLALPRRVDRWLYDIAGEETIETPVGPLRAFRMVPRRAVAPAGELVIEAWFAPSLQFLPVRIVLRQGAEAFADLTLSRWPQQAAPAASGPSR